MESCQNPSVFVKCVAVLHGICGIGNHGYHRPTSYQWRSEVNKTGLYSIHLRVTIDRELNAQMRIRFGAERPVLSKMMGHEKEQTTENYYKVNLREVIEGTKAVNFEKYAL